MAGVECAEIGKSASLGQRNGRPVEREARGIALLALKRLVSSAYSACSWAPLSMCLAQKPCHSCACRRPAACMRRARASACRRAGGRSNAGARLLASRRGDAGHAPRWQLRGRWRPFYCRRQATRVAGRLVDKESAKMTCFPICRR